MSDQDIRLEIELLKKDVTIISAIVGRLDSTIEKLQDLSSSVLRMLALHDEKLLQSAKEDRDILGEIRIHTEEDHIRFRELETKINNLIEAIHERMSRTETNILTELRLMNNPKDDVDEKTWVRKIFGIYPWMFAGGIATLLWVMTHINLVELAKFIK